MVVDGKTIRTDESYATFITQTDAPDISLKADQFLPSQLREFFRPVAISTPDTHTILQVMMLSLVNEWEMSLMCRDSMTMTPIPRDY